MGWEGSHSRSLGGIARGEQEWIVRRRAKRLRLDTPPRASQARMRPLDGHVSLRMVREATGDAELSGERQGSLGGSVDSVC